MKSQLKPALVLAFLLVSAGVTRADIVIHDMGSTAANTLTTLGKDFIIGCAILAIGVVAAVFIAKKK